MYFYVWPRLHFGLMFCKLGSACDCTGAGNSFHSYVQRWAHRSKKDSADRPHELLAVSASGTAVELPVSEAEFPVTSAFNHLSLHLFPEWKVSELDMPQSVTSAPQIIC